MQVRSSLDHVRIVSTKFDRHHKPRTTRAELERTPDVHPCIRTSPSNIIRQSRTLSRTFEHSRTHSTMFEQTRPPRIELVHQRTSPDLVRNSFEHFSEPILGPTTLIELARSSKLPRTTFEHHSIGFRAILSNSAAVFLIDNDCTSSPRCPRSYDIHIA